MYSVHFACIVAVCYAQTGTLICNLNHNLNLIY